MRRTALVYKLGAYNVLKRLNFKQLAQRIEKLSGVISTKLYKVTNSVSEHRPSTLSQHLNALRMLRKNNKNIRNQSALRGMVG